MSTSSNTVVNQVIGSIFANNAVALRQDLKVHGRSKKIPMHDLELALAVLLVDLASCDQDFDSKERDAIIFGISRVFGTERFRVGTLINEAQHALNNLRGPSKFVDLLKQNTSIEQRQLMLDVINEVIMADSKEDGFEIYLRQKFKEQLGL